MNKYEIHRGVGSPLELFGLKSFYIFLIPLSLALSIMLFFILTLNSMSTLEGLIISTVFAIMMTSAILFVNHKFRDIDLTIILAHRMIPYKLINYERLFI